MNSIKKYAWYLKYKLDRSVIEETYDPVNTGIVSDYYDWICELISKGYVSRIGLPLGSSDDEKIAMLKVIAIGINVNCDEVTVITYDEFLSNLRDGKLKGLGI